MSQNAVLAVSPHAISSYALTVNGPAVELYANLLELVSVPFRADVNLKGDTSASALTLTYLLTLFLTKGKTIRKRARLAPNTRQSISVSAHNVVRATLRVQSVGAPSGMTVSVGAGFASGFC